MHLIKPMRPRRRSLVKRVTGESAISLNNPSMGTSPDSGTTRIASLGQLSRRAMQR